MSKLLEMQGMMEEIKKKLDTIEVEGKSPEDKVVVKITANNRVKEINISDDLIGNENKDELEDMLVIAFNRAVENAANVAASEQASITNNIMPGLGNMFS